jgi:hypothetical protein
MGYLDKLRFYHRVLSAGTLGLDESYMEGPGGSAKTLQNFSAESYRQILGLS